MSDPKAKAVKALEDWLATGDLEGVAQMMAWANIKSLKRKTKNGVIKVILE